MRIIAASPPEAVTTHIENGVLAIRFADNASINDDGGPTGLPLALATPPAAAPATDAKPYRSEFLVYVQDTNHKVNSNGELMCPDGVTVYTKPDLHAPLNGHYDKPGRTNLENDAMAKNYDHEVQLDSTVIQQGNKPPALYGSNADGSVGVIAGAVLPAPAPRITLPPSPVGSARVVDIDARVGEVKVYSSGISTETTEYRITPAELFNSGYDGFARTLERAGSVRAAKDMTVALDGRLFFDSTGKGDPSPQCNLTRADVAGVALIVVTVRNASYEAGLPYDHAFEYAAVGR